MTVQTSLHICEVLPSLYTQSMGEDEVLDRYLDLQPHWIYQLGCLNTLDRLQSKTLLTIENEDKKSLQMATNGNQKLCF